MKAALIELIDFEKVNILLEGFNKTTGFVTAILDLDGNVLSKSGWRQMCTDFHRINPETSKKCAISDTELANNIADGKKYHFYKCLNGLVDVAVPIVINGEHIANLFSGQFFFEEPDHTFFKKQAEKYGFDEKKYMEALAKVPVVTKEKVEDAMDFLLNMTQLISESTFQRLEQTILNKALKQSEDRFQLLFNKAPLGYQSLDIDGHFIEVNQQWLDTLGYERDEVIGKWFGDFLTPMYQEGFRKRFPIFKAQGHIHSEFEMVHKNGSILFIAFDGRIGNDTDGNFMQTHCILQDITESKRVKEALLEAEWKFKALFEFGPIGVAYHRMIYDESGKPFDYYFIDANACYNELTGMSPKGMTVRQAFPGIENDPFDWIGKFGHVAKTGETIRFEQYLETNGRWYDCVGYQYKPDHFVAAFNEITKRKEAEIASQKSEEKFRSFFENSVVGKSITTIEGKLSVNNAFCQIVGYSKEELIKLNWKEITHQDDIEKNVNVVNYLLSGNKDSERWEKRYIHKDGHIVWTDISTTLQRDKDGNPLYFITAVNDITEKKLAEKALLESEERFKVLFENAPDAMLLADPETGKVVDANNTACKMFKKQKPDLVGLFQYELHPTHEIDKSKETFKTQFEENDITGKMNPIENSIVCSDGTEIPVEIMGQSIKIGNKVLMMGTFRDITERKKAEQALKQSEEKFAIAFKTSPYAITITRPEDGKFIEVNDAFFSMTGYSPEEALNNSSIGMDLWFDAENRNNVLKVLQVGGAINGQEFLFKKKNGEIITGLFSAQLINIKNNTYILSSINDITERKKAEEALIQKEKDFRNLIELSPVAMCIIHDWKTIYFNPSAVLLFGAKTQSEILNKHIYEFIHPDFQELAIENAKSLAEKGYVDMQEQQYIKLDGSILDVETQAKSIRFNDDTATLVVMNNITERKNAEKVMLENSMRLELAMQAANMAWWEMEMPSGNIIFNKRKAEMLGYSPENFKHYTDFMSLVHPEDAAKAMVAMRNHMYGTAKVYETEYRIVTNTGEYKWFYDIGSVVERDSTGNPLKITGLVLDVSKRKQWEELLKESEERYSSLLLHLETGIVVHARDTSIIMSNRRASEILGLTNDQMKGKTAIDPAWKFVDIDKTPLLLDNFPVNRIKNSKKSIKNQIIGIQKSLEQDITWVNINGFPVLNSIGEITEIVISFNDITERKKAETLLENERSLYLDLVNTQPAGIYRIRVFSKENWGEDAWTKADTPPYKIELMSDRFCEILEIDPQKFESHPGILVDLVHPDDKEEFVRRNEEANTLVSIFNWDCRLLINNNLKWIHFESLPRKLENGDILFTGIIYDITEQKIAQEKLRDSEMRFRKILQDVESLSVQGYAPDGTTQYWNKASERLYGYTAEEAIGKNFTDLIIPSEMREGVKQIIKQMAETGQALPASELSLMRKDGSMVTVFSNHTIVQIAGQPQELFCIDIDLTELKKAEEALRESEELLSLYIKNSPIYSFIKEVSEYESKVLYASENFIDMIGISGHEMIGKTMFELFPPEFAKKITADDWDVHKTSEVLKLDETLNGKDYITFKFPIVQGNRNLLAGFTIDISERKHAEELFIDIVNKNPMSIQIVDKEGYTLQTNPAFIELFGSIPPSYYSIFEDLISKGPEFERLIHQVISGEVVHLPDIYYNVHDILPEAPNNPHWIRALIFPLKDINGKPERFVIMHEDITERKNAEQALKESEEKLSTLFSSMTEMVVMHQMIYNENGEAINYLITDCNKAFTDITGIRKEDAVGRLSTEVYRIETAPYLKEYANVCATGKSFDFNTYFAPMEKYFLISAVSIGNNRFSTISTDITTNEQIHEIIKEKNKELENYIYVASHDLRSPLVNIQGFSKRLQKQTSEIARITAEINTRTEIVTELKKITSEDIPKSLSFILNNVSKMDTLINGLLQVSRTGRVVMSPAILEMNKLFKSILTIFDYQLKEMEANVVLHELDSCYGDTNQLNQLFSNIIGNALKYSDKNRILTLEISSQTKYNKVIYSIKDNGIGINNRHLQKIWDVFYRVDASAPEAGEGLGLSLAKRIVDKHKGKIWAESVEGEGSTFYVELHKNKFEE